MSDSFEIRAVNESDYEFILRVNEENVEVLSPMDREKLEAFVKMAEMFAVALAGGNGPLFSSRSPRAPHPMKARTINGSGRSSIGFCMLTES